MTPILNHCFTRTNWPGATAVNIDTPRALHLKHNCVTPFESLNVLLPREIQLDDQSLEEKPVIAHRGGYCFEQNGVFKRVLHELEPNVRSLLGRVVLSNPPALSPRTHHLLLTELEEEKWIAGVGFGRRTLTEPIRLVSDFVQTIPHGDYWLLQEGSNWVLQSNRHQHWQSMYRFDLYEQQQSDYVMGNFWSAHWPQSHFYRHLLICRHLPDGGKLIPANFHFTHYGSGHTVE